MRRFFYGGQKLVTLIWFDSDRRKNPEHTCSPFLTRVVLITAERFNVRYSHLSDVTRCPTDVGGAVISAFCRRKLPPEPHFADRKSLVQLDAPAIKHRY